MRKVMSAWGPYLQGVVSAALLLGAPSVRAAASFDATAGLTYTLTDIINAGNPGSRQGLSLSASFSQAGSPDLIEVVSGDGLVQAQNPAVGPVAIEDTFSHSFQVRGSVSDGSVTSSHLGQYELAMTNTGTDSFTVSLRMDYALTAVANGPVEGSAFADNDIFLDYFARTDTAVAGSDQVNASLLGLANSAVTGSTGLLTFTLAPGTSESLLTDVRINGLLEAAAVPLPASLPLLLAALGMLSRGVRRSPA